MKTFTATPAQFQSGEMARLAVHSLRPPRKPGKKRPPRKWLERQVGTITPAQFQRGDPWIGHHRREGHLQEPLPELKPLPEAIAQALLDDGPGTKALILQQEPELVGDMLASLQGFIAHARLDEDLGRYFQAVLMAAAQHIAQLPAFEHPQPVDFAYLPKDYSFDDPFVSYAWECRNFNPNVVWIGQFGDKEATRKAEATVQAQRQAQDALAEALNAIPAPPVVKHIEVGDEEGNLAVQVLLKQNIFDDPWTEGAPGYYD